MKKLIILILVITCSRIGKGQLLFLNKTDSNYFINEKILTANDKICYTINCISKNDSLFESTGGITPLIFIKIFAKTPNRELPQRPVRYLDITEYIFQNALPRLKTDLLLTVSDLSSVSRSENVNVYDSLLLFDGKTYTLFEGVIEISFYNLMDFEQLNIQQSNPTIINTEAKIAPIIKKKDGSVLVDLDKVQHRGIFEKLYLIKKEKDLYTYFLVSIDHNEDDPLDYSKEFVYKKNYGIVSFKGKWLFFYKSDLPKEPRGLFASTEYFHFK